MSNSHEELKCQLRKYVEDFLDEFAPDFYSETPNTQSFDWTFYLETKGLEGLERLAAKPEIAELLWSTERSGSAIQPAFRDAYEFVIKSRFERHRNAKGKEIQLLIEQGNDELAYYFERRYYLKEKDPITEIERLTQIKSICDRLIYNYQTYQKL